MQSPADFHDSRRNDWCRRGNKTTTFWELCGIDLDWISVNLEIWIRIRDHFMLRSFVVAELCAVWSQSSCLCKCWRNWSVIVIQQDLSDVNPLIATLTPQSNGPSYSNTVIGTLAVDGYSEDGTVGGGCSPPRPLLAVPNVTSRPSTASVPTSYYSMCTIIAFRI